MKGVGEKKNMGNFSEKKIHKISKKIFFGRNFQILSHFFFG